MPFWKQKIRVKNGDTEVDITGFEFNVATGELGGTLSLRLAAFNPTIDASQIVSFELGVKKGASTDYAMLMSDGRIKLRSDQTQLSGDETSINVISQLSRKWKLTPERPITLYDPTQVSIATDAANTRNAVVGENGLPILPIYQPVTSLDLNYLLNFIYVGKLGFGRVVTNIPNYLIPRADFSFRSPWHSIAAGQVGLFDPEWSSEGLDTLYITDPQAALAAGFPAMVRNCGPNSYATLNKSEETEATINVMLLSYNARSDGGTAEIFSLSETHESGTYPNTDWQRTVTNRTMLRVRDPENPARILRDNIETSKETIVSAIVDDLTQIISREVETSTYDYDYQVKTGWTRQVSVRMAFPGESAKMRQVYTEIMQIKFDATGNPNELIKTVENREVHGGVLVEGDGDDAIRTALYDVNARGLQIPDDATVETDRPISSTLSTWAEAGPDQIQVQDDKTDHLNGTKPVVSNPTPHTGTIRVRLSGNFIKRTMRIPEPISIGDIGALPPASLDAGDIPFSIANGLAQRILARHGQRPQTVTIDYAGLDLSLRRGSLRRVSNRAGDQWLVYVTGFKITGSNLGSYSGASLKMTADGIILQAL